ncbi:MAG: VCBS repeat-containing protein, partial [Victivallales bacterium]|nr:VCBS repeat-containing protein [Victivallales bacterium]
DKECFTLSTGREMRFYTSDKERRIQLHFAVDVPMALAVAVGDLDGDGQDDLAFACRDTGSGDGQRSHIYLNRGGCFPAETRLSVRTAEACDVCILDNRVLFGCSSRLERYTNDSLLFELSQGKLSQEPVRFEGEDTRRVAMFRNPDGNVRLFLQNHYSRSALGYDQAYIYWGGPDGYDPARMTPVPCWCGVDSLSADLDDDGWAELLLANNSENSLHLDPGHHIHHFGPDGFEPKRSRTIQTDIGWGVVVADFDRDGYLEIATPCHQWNDLRIFHGRDDFRSWTDIPLAGKGSARWICAVDLNRDGWLELVVPLITTDRTLILWGGPDGFSLERSSELAVNHGVFATAADLNGNGWPDLIVGGHTETPKKGELLPHQPHVSWLHIYWNGPEGLSETRRTMLRADAACSISVADFNGDGFLDIFAGSYHGGIDRDINSFLYWNRQGHFHELDRQLLFTHSASGSIACDFDEDGRVDLAIANHKVDGDHLGYSCVWWNGPHGFNEERTTRLPTCGPHGMCSVNPGNILDRGDEEYYLSEPFQVQEDATVAAIDLTAELPPKTWVTAMLRTSPTRDGLNTAAWLPPQGCQVAARSWLQYRLAIGARNSLRTPRVTRVAVRWQ